MDQFDLAGLRLAAAKIKPAQFKRRRIAAGLSLFDAGQLAGKSALQWSRYERGLAGIPYSVALVFLIEVEARSNSIIKRREYIKRRAKSVAFRNDPRFPPDL